MCMMCEEEALYAAYLEWKAQKEREEAAQSAAAGSDAGPSAADASARSEPAAKPKFVCD